VFSLEQPVGTPIQTDADAEKREKRERKPGHNFCFDRNRLQHEGLGLLWYTEKSL